ncbi:hypothetical protein [Enterocloster clostridioformis]
MKNRLFSFINADRYSLKIRHYKKYIIPIAFPYQNQNKRDHGCGQAGEEWVFSKSQFCYDHIKGTSIRLHQPQKNNSLFGKVCPVLLDHFSMYYSSSRCIIILSLKNGWVIMRRKTIDTIPVLSDAMKNILSAFSKSRSLPSGLVKRASIVLPASQGELNQNIAPQAGLHYNNVATWRSRFLAALPALRKIEMDDPEKLEDEYAKNPERIL